MRRRYRLDENGVTLLELMLVLVTMAIVVAAIPLTFRSGTSIWDRGDSHAEAMQNGLIGIENVTRDLIQAYSITSVSYSSDPQGYIHYKPDWDSAEDSKYEYYQPSPSESELRRGEGVDLNPLTEPVESLTFTVYDKAGNTLNANVSEPVDTSKIDSVQVQLVTPDKEGDINSIPLTSRVYLRGDIGEPPPGIHEFAIFGGRGVELRNNLIVGGHNPPSNVGTNGLEIYIKNLVEVYGSIVFPGCADEIDPSCAQDSLNLQNPSQIITLPDLYVSNQITILALPTGYPDRLEVDLGVAPSISLLASGPPDITLPRPGDSVTDGANIPPASAGFLRGYYYGDLELDNGKKLIFAPQAGDDDGTGYFNYYFKSITAGNNLQLEFDMSLNMGINIFVEGQVDIGSQLDGSITGISGMTPQQAAAYIYFESHHIQYDYSSTGMNSDCSWAMGNDTLWFGTVYCPYGSVKVVDGVIWGSILSGCGYAEVHGGSVSFSSSTETEVDYVGSVYLGDRPYTGWLCPPVP